MINDVNVKQSPAINLTSGSFLPLPIDQPLLSNQYSAVIDEDFKLLNSKLKIYLNARVSILFFNISKYFI